MNFHTFEKIRITSKFGEALKISAGNLLQVDQHTLNLIIDIKKTNNKQSICNKNITIFERISKVSFKSQLRMEISEQNLSQNFDKS